MYPQVHAAEGGWILFFRWGRGWGWKEGWAVDLVIPVVPSRQQMLQDTDFVYRFRAAPYRDILYPRS